MSSVAPAREIWKKEDIEKRPYIIIYEMTRACNLACVHCRAEAQPKPDPLELSTDEAFSLIDEISTIQPAIFVLTGGDPFLRKDLQQIIQYAVSKSLHVSITPSVTRKVTEQAMYNLKEWGISQIAFSLDGATAAVHDGFRKVPGTYERTLKAMRWASDAGLTLQINTTVCRSTIQDITGIPAIAEKFAVQLWSLFFIIPTGRASIQQMLSPEEHEDVYRYIYALSKDVPFRIKATEAPAYRRFVLQQQEISNLIHHSSGNMPVINDGSGFVFVSHTGGIYPSGFLPLEAGNVRSSSLLQIYQEHPLFKDLRNPSKLKGKCGYCEYNSICGGSRSRAYAVNKDPLASDPSCLYMPPAFIKYQESKANHTADVAISFSQESLHSKQTGVLLMAYGTPDNLESIESFYTHIRHGKAPAPELLQELSNRYKAIGGTSPLYTHTINQVAAIRDALEQRLPGSFHVALGMKHAHPFIEEGIAELVQSGVHSIIGMVLAPHYSSLSIGEYEERVKAALEGQNINTAFIESWHLNYGYIQYLSKALRETLKHLMHSTGLSLDQIEVLITAHSLPSRILSMKDPYPKQLEETARKVAGILHLKRWSVAWQSAGKTSEPWIGPSILEKLPQIKENGAKGVVVCPAGFVSDHLEVLYDLDVEAMKAAQNLGLYFTRTSMPNDDHDFCTALAEEILQKAEYAHV